MAVGRRQRAAHGRAAAAGPGGCRTVLPYRRAVHLYFYIFIFFIEQATGAPGLGPVEHGRNHNGAARRNRIKLCRMTRKPAVGVSLQVLVLLPRLRPPARPHALSIAGALPRRQAEALLEYDWHACYCLKVHHCSWWCRVRPPSRARWRVWRGALTASGWPRGELTRVCGCGMQGAGSAPPRCRWVGSGMGGSFSGVKTKAWSRVCLEGPVYCVGDTVRAGCTVRYAGRLPADVGGLAGAHDQGPTVPRHPCCLAVT